MKSNFVEIIHFAFFVGICFILTMLLLTTFLHVINYKTEFLNLNPPDPLNNKTIFFAYPDLGEETRIAVLNNSPFTYPVTLGYNISLQYRGTLAQGTPVNVSIVGIVHNKDPFWVVTLGFENAIPDNGEIVMYNPVYATATAEYPPQQYLKYNPSPAVYPNEESLETISWNEPGDYSPFITVNYINGTSTTIAYPLHKIHIVSSDIVEQEKYSDSVLWLSITLMAFTLVTSIQLLIPLIPKKLLNRIISKYKSSKTEDDNSYQ